VKLVSILYEVRGLIGIGAIFVRVYCSGVRMRRSSLSFSLITALAYWAGNVSATDPPRLYPAGEFPPGTIYSADQMIGLDEGTIPTPCYITGRFLCLENRPGLALFASYTKHGDQLVFGKLVLNVTFFGNCPPGLHAGSVIAPDSRDPLTIKAVFHRNDLTVVTAESWSLPQKQNNN
jgi:hypothetical protein